MSKIKFLNLVMVLALALGMVPAVSGASPVAAPAAAPVAGAEPVPAAVPPVQPTQAERIPPHAQEIPAAETDGSVPARLPRSLQEIPSGMVIIELEGEPLAVQYAARKAANQQLSAKQMEQAKAQLEAAQLALKPRLENLGAKIVSNYTAVYNGFLAQIPPDSGAAMLALPGVKAIHRAPEYVPTLGTSVPLIGAPQVWQNLGYKGENIVIAVIDTGIDYTHAALGGSGNPNDYATNNPDVREPGTFPTAKVIFGYDFAGTTYNANPSSPAYQPIPIPDTDPLDENGHGTHVASIAAGIAAGQVMTGVAPMAKLMALKVFGAEGSTNLVVDALEMATAYYLLKGWPQVINMSLGSSYGPGNIDDPDVVASNNAVAAGIVVVASAGNSANVPYIVGSPGTADKVISVAGSTTGYVTGPTIDVQGTTNPTQTNIIYMPPDFSPDGHFTQTVTATLAYVGNYAPNAELCTTAITPTTALQGKVALIERGTCSFAVKVRNAKALGAVGAIIFNSAAGGNTYVTMADDGGDNFIPAGFIARQDGLNLIPANGQTVTVSAENIVRTVVDRYTPADSVYPASSRGPRGTDSKLKPEVGAPGYNIFAADMGTGVNGVTYSGTSMAAPHVAGVAALIKQAHPNWTPEQVKAALMNTAKDYADNSPIPRVGAGRVDAYRAVDTKVVAVGEPDLVSFSGFFATGANTYVTTRTVTVYNHDTTNHTYNLGWALQSSSLTGVNVAFATPTIVVPAQGAATATITFTFDTTQIPADFLTQEEIYGYVTLTPLPYLIITKTVTTVHTPVLLGDVVTYTVEVANDGSIAATNVHITDTLPAGLTGQNLDETVDIAASHKATFIFTATVSTDPTYYGQTILNTAYFSHASGNGQASASFALEPGTVTLSIAKSVVTAHTPVLLGDVVTYTVEVANDGSIAATNVHITDTLPAGLTGQNLDETVDIAASHKATFIFTATVSTDPTYYGQTILNTAYFSHASGNGQASASFQTKDLFMVYLPLVLNNYRSGGSLSQQNTLLGLRPEDILRIPFSFVPRPYTALTITGDGVIEDPEEDYATYVITQTGPISSSLWVYPTLVTDPLDTGGPGDIKAVGMDYGGNSSYGPILIIALSSWGAAHTAHYYFVEYDLYVDTNEDGVYDYVLYNTPDSSNANYYRVTIYNLSTRTSTLSPFTAYTDYNSGLMEWYVPVSSTMGLNPTTNPDFNFEVVGFEPTADFTDSVADETTPGRFNYAQYPLGWDYSGDPGPGDRNAEVYVWVNSVAGYGYSQPKGVMIVDYPGNPTNGGQVYLKPFSAPITAVDLLHTNDFHGQLEPSGSNPGIARVAYAVNNLRDLLGEENVVLLDGGDEMQGSLLSNLKKGEPTIDLFNFLGYQAATFGNHEFDWGQQVLISRTQQATYPFLAANLVVSDSGSCATAGWTVPAFTRPWMTMTVGTPGKQIVLGLIGVTSQETPYITVAEATQGLCFKDAADSIDHYYNDVIAAGAQAIVIISHLGNTDGGYGYGIPVYGDQTLARKLVEKGKPANLIIGAHSHTDLSAAQLISGTTVVQAHYNGRKVGNATLIFDQYNNTLAIRWRRIAINTTAPTDTPTANRLATWTSDPAYQAQINQIIGYTNVPLVRRSTIDNMMGTFVNDAIYNQLNNDAETLNDADMVFNNSGGLRADITGTYPLTLTYGALFTVLPFGNQTIVGDMTGAQIYDLLNQSATLFKGTLQVAGIRFAYYSYGSSTTTFDGYHSTWWAWGAYSITIKNRNTGLWEPLVMTKTYRVATNEFLAPAGQDGFTPFKYMTNISYWGDMLNQVIAWVSAHHATPATAYNGPNGDGSLDGRILREGNDSSGPIIPVTILHHNDSHGRLLPSGSNPGYTNLVTLIRQEWANNPQRTILLNAGDTIQGDAMAAYYKAAFTGKGADGTTLPITLTTNPIIAAMNAMTYTAMTLGNHEFNYGNYVFTGTLGQANFPLLQANVYDDGSYGLAQVNVRPFITTTVGPEGIKIAILGIGNHRVPNYELPSNIPGLTFTNPITETQARAPALKATNDAVVALTHIGFTEDPSSIEVDTNVDTNLAAQTTGIDAIIGGHSHTNPSTGYGPYKFLPTFVGAPDNTPVIINQAYRYNTYLGEVILGMRAKAGGGYEVVARAGKYIQVKTDIPEATDIKAIVTPYNDFLQTYRNRTLGQTTVPIDTLNAYTQETNGANLQADASLWKLNQVFGAGYVQAHLSGAMTNARVAATASATNPVTLTINDMFTLMPYENSLVVFRLNGPQLKTILERAYRNYWYYKYGGPSHGGYSYYTTCMLDVSAGSVITYDEDPLTYTVGSDYVVGFSINGNPVDFLDATTYYTISTVNYIAAGSCNFNNGGVTLWPLDQIVQDTQYYVRDVVIEYIPTLTQPIAPAIEGRLVFQ